jgi:hypothetical protein
MVSGLPIMTIRVISDWEKFIAGETIDIYLKFMYLFLYTILHYFSRQYSPLITIIAQLITSIKLSFWSENLEEQDFNKFFSEFMVLCLVLDAINYNEFIVNFLLQPPAILLPILKMSIRQEFNSNIIIFNWILITVALQIKPYLKQKDLIQVVIL